MNRRVLAGAVAVVLAAACGSGDKSSSGEAAPATTPVVAGAQENAAASGAVCHDWPAGTTVVPCAVDAMGPGGGRVFYDAGSAQAWGRFLEVAPQAWNGTLVDCLSCGAADGLPKKTSDRDGLHYGYYPCRNSEVARLLPGEAGDTLWEIGGGRHNTEVLSKTADCVDGSVSALTLAAGYRGGGLSDWYLPSGGELTELCKYTGRNAIGGFSADKYASSTVGPQGDYTNFHQVKFSGNPLCERSDGLETGLSGGNWLVAYVRPIRAFS